MRAVFALILLGAFILSAPVPAAADGYLRAGESPKSEKADAEQGADEAAPPAKKAEQAARPSRSDSMLDFAADLIARKKYAQAISVLEDVLKRNPANADAYTYMGFANLQLGDLSAAESKLRLALKIDSRHLGANQHLGEVFAKRGKVSRALDQLTVLKMLCRTSCPEKEALESAINRAGKG